MPTIDPIRLEERTRTLDRCVRRRNTFEYFGCAAVAVIFGLQALGLFGASGGALAETLMRSGAALIALAAVFIAIEIRRRTAPLRNVARSENQVSACITQLDRQRRALETAWLWYTAPLIPGFLLIYAGQAAKPNAGFLWPVISAVVTIAVLGWVALMNRRAARGFGEEIGRLEQMARHSP